VLVVLVGDDDDAIVALRQIEGLWVLGPAARVLVGPLPKQADAQTVVACAHAPGQLDGLRRGLRTDAVALALSPTPAWLWQVLDQDALRGAAVAGTIAARSLGSQWVRWARARGVPHVLVPVGVRTPDLDADDDEALSAVAAAHALECRTGPVFPASRVITLVLDGLRHGLAPADEADAGALAVWMQAKRALPVTGSIVGMDAPLPGLPVEAPTAAFLAQRSLLRAGAFDRALSSVALVSEHADADGIARSHEILRNAGQTLTDQESKVVLRGFGFEVTRQAVSSSASGAAGFAERIGFPVVLKALSADLRRRSDVGGVVLGLSTGAAVRREYGEVVARIERDAPTARLDGVLVAEMLPAGLDIRCGGRRLASGEVVVYGVIEGASVPLEPALGLAPMEARDAIALAHAVLSRVPVPGLRRSSDPDVAGLAEVFLRLCTIFAEAGPRVDSVDLGPLRLCPDRGYVVLDARIVQQPHLQGV
jgi:hypothetical protein